MPAERVISRQTGLEDEQYKWGFEFDYESDTAPKGLSEEIVRFISAKKNEPDWLLDWRLKAYRHWETLGAEAPTWANIHHDPVDFQDMIYYAAPKSQADGPKSLDDVDPEILAAFDKLGIPLQEQKQLTGVAVDAVLDSVSVATTYKKMLEDAGVVFCSISEAVQNHPDIVRKYLGSVVPYTDNFYATLNSAVFSDGSFCYVPPGVRCPIDLMTYFRINALNTGQFERTLIVADKNSYVSYLEGCTAPMRKTHQLHAAVVELVTLDDAEIKYSTLQNWYPGDKDGNGGVYNFVTKRGKAQGKNSKISWTQVETGSAITWKYPSVMLLGDNSVGEFYSVALVNNYQQADTGTKMIHIGKNTRSTIVAKGISAGKAQNTYRGQVKVMPTADNARNFTQCDSLLIGDQCGAHTVPYIEVRNPTAQMGHEATTSKVNDDQLFYLQQRGIDMEEANYMIINGFCRGIFKELPFEFAAEASQLLRVSLEGVVG
ncbi:MAG: Fe-S cluster assembly protein SufB [SAR202 cluster bacterium]|jgi:Fe-S cluster assembly protein SufB|nr:Fe-S cluster assembly protein SufB [Chloroflexota bacterium]MDP6421342.1 Fe-S cluster assembly protein SufB [SAR202 cluster bacterium]HAL48064.1 Fe-S cluster assembly protein SufB [Dehalococcoidia bacterium]MDP6665573.1 Fe-S cluster assembly protein SufB [SAR202 cluster bacterium]MDP6799214.1 Fe-S cluster assembly protein SufB [SAR202 cluster bacterium]|tara:strand:- start:7909 stop:9369 length:1461 start_codon:yes stop_codon:yes gene_type:complete